MGPVIADHGVADTSAADFVGQSMVVADTVSNVLYSTDTNTKPAGVDWDWDCNTDI